VSVFPSPCHGGRARADQHATAAAIKLAGALCKGYGVTALPTAATCASTPTSTSGGSSSTTGGSSSTTTPANASGGSNTSAAAATNTPGAAAANAGSGLGAGLVAAGVLALL
jgi:hypothetical protein